MLNSDIISKRNTTKTVRSIQCPTGWWEAASGCLVNIVV